MVGGEGERGRGGEGERGRGGITEGYGPDSKYLPYLGRSSRVVHFTESSSGGLDDGDDRGVPGHTAERLAHRQRQTHQALAMRVTHFFFFFLIYFSWENLVLTLNEVLCSMTVPTTSCGAGHVTSHSNRDTISTETP